jgi:ATP-dependent exoDNAse (exonuclease V) alpha subunit
VVVDETSMVDVILANKLWSRRCRAAGVFNGTVGVVVGISLEEHSLTVLTDEDERVDYGFDELVHAYAVTVHRSQGSEYPAVVIPLTMGSWMMLQRNLLYTGVTRAKRLVVRAGSRRALTVSVHSKGTGAAITRSATGCAFERPNDARRGRWSGCRPPGLTTESWPTTA